MPNRKGARFARRRWMGADGEWWVEREGNWPTQMDTRDRMLASVDVSSEEAVEGPDFWLEIPYVPGSGGSRAREKIYNKLGKRGQRNGRSGS